MTDDAAAIVYDEIQKTDVLTGAKYISFAEGVENGMIRFVGDDCKRRCTMPLRHVRCARVCARLPA